MTLNQAGACICQLSSSFATFSLKFVDLNLKKRRVDIKCKFELVVVLGNSLNKSYCGKLTRVLSLHADDDARGVL